MCGGSSEGWRAGASCCTAWCLAALLVLALAGPARAGGDPFADIATTNFDTVAHGVSVLAVSGSPRAIPVIDALRDGRLFAWRWPRPDAPLYIRTAKGFVDARSGAQSRPLRR